MKKLLILSLTTLGLLTSSLGHAASVKVEWKNVDKYTDIRAGEENRARFKQNTMATLEKHISKLAEKLPENQKLLITVTNLDLAGNIEYSGGRSIRVIRDLFIPRMNFSYQLLDDNKQPIKQDDVKLKDMNFMMTSALRYRQKPLGYEKKMIDDWFVTTFLPKKPTRLAAN